MGNNKVNILIVEDDSIIARAIISKFKIRNVDVDLAVDGEEALQKLKSGNYKIILLDLLLPNKNGFWLLKQIHEDERLRSIKILIFSNLSATETAHLTKNFSIVDYIIKSEVSIDDIATRIIKLVL